MTKARYCKSTNAIQMVFLLPILKSWYWGQVLTTGQRTSAFCHHGRTLSIQCFILFRLVGKNQSISEWLQWSHIASERKSHRSQYFRPFEPFIRVQHVTGVTWLIFCWKVFIRVQHGTGVTRLIFCRKVFIRVLHGTGVTWLIFYEKIFILASKEYAL